MKQRLRELWQGRVPLARVFWQYTILYGTLLNLLTTLASLAAFAKDAPAWLALLIFFLPVPYNVLMIVSVWKSAAHFNGPSHWSVAARMLVVLWAVFVSFA